MNLKQSVPDAREEPASGFTPALGYSSLTGLYDRAVRLLTRERRWRSLLLEQVSPQPGETIVDVGCGTGTFAIMLKLHCPQCHVVGIDPDPDALAIAQAKAATAQADIEWRQGFASSLVGPDQRFDKAVSSLVFHQVPVTEKRAAISAMARSLAGGGEIHVADYSRQHGILMRSLFRIVQNLDGYQNTQPNADGILEDILSAEALEKVVPTCIVRTPTGAISLYRITIRRRLGTA